MAATQLASSAILTFTKLPSTSSRTLLGFSSNAYSSCQVRCMVAATSNTDKAIVRRSANFQTPIWDFNFIQSLSSEYVGHSFTRQANKLKEDARLMLEEALNPLDQLDLIDTLQRLGIAYHFEEEISSITKNIYNDNHRDDTKMIKEDNLYANALEFRLLRQHGYNVPQEVFNSFKDDQGNFKACLCNDIKGMLYLYEASYLLVEGESILEEARDFAAKHLKKHGMLNKDQYLSILANHALELPLHWRMKRMEAKWFIDAYERRLDFKPILLDFAKLDYNMVQAKHQEDIKDASRWDINAIEPLPHFMKITFFALYNTANEMAYKILKEQKINVVPSLKKMWGDLCRAYLQEARWYHAGYKPTLKEYLGNAWMSISTPLVLGHAFFFITNPITEEASKCIMEYPDIIRYSSLIFRLANDLGTSSDEIARGDVPKSIQCYMHETGATEEEAREHMGYLINETWKKINRERFAEYPFSQTFMDIPINLGRSALFFYQYGDGYAIQDGETKDRLTSIFVQPIALVGQSFGN
ncbi:unnamed protein product [Dovyalis caffra]|uniref:(+)-delta-cadinene synthase n=1 Tax=Dovyalis caffra TaxID=77055 RepID=A0AAV1SFU6_9ROSI|nr:unnamed protein product [Dovyalis caffra]